MQCEHIEDAYSAGAHKRLSDASIATAVAGGNQVSDAAAFEERLQIAVRVEQLDKLRICSAFSKSTSKVSYFGHLHEAETNDGRFRVVAHAETIDEARRTRHNVLEGTG